ncbi:MAG TPA: hypothetical protein VFQ22_02735 [Longimicrobiales bacterium]|nr:hypothetical protein [Longimicrobiales bacterium]
MDARVLRTFEEPVTGPAGEMYVAQVAGRRAADGRWDGWIEFIPRDGSPVLRSLRETTQVDLGALERWAAGLSLVYLQGSLGRTLTRERAHPPRVADEPEPAFFDGPAPDLRGGRRPAPDDVALNPILEFRRGEEHVRRRIAELGAAELRAVVLAYFDRGGTVDVDALGREELEELIVEGARARAT